MFKEISLKITITGTITGTITSRARFMEYYIIRKGEGEMEMGMTFPRVEKICGKVL